MQYDAIPSRVRTACALVVALNTCLDEIEAHPYYKAHATQPAAQGALHATVEKVRALARTCSSNLERPHGDVSAAWIDTCLSDLQVSLLQCLTFLKEMDARTVRAEGRSLH